MKDSAYNAQLVPVSVSGYLCAFTSVGNDANASPSIASATARAGWLIPNHTHSAANDNTPHAISTTISGDNGARVGRL